MAGRIWGSLLVLALWSSVVGTLATLEGCRSGAGITKPEPVEQRTGDRPHGHERLLQKLEPKQYDG